MAEVSLLPLPVVATWEWQLHAACRDVNSVVFFGPDREGQNSRERREREAKLVCRGCPVLRQCRDHALRVGEPYGVWGGMTARERDRYRRYVRPGSGSGQSRTVRS